MTRKSFLALATLTLLVATVLRVWQLATYPPGPHYDEAAELLIARSIAFGGARFFPMVEAYQGREVLFYYLSAPLLTWVSDGIFSLRVLSVFCNLITIAAAMALGRAMFRGRRGVIVGLAVGVLMTLSFPMIWLSRQAFRSSALPMMQALALLFLFKGLRVGTRRAVPLPTTRLARIWARSRAPLLLIIGGIFAGGAVYTYNASRLFPFWLLIGGLAILWFDRAHLVRRIGESVAFFGALAITAAPMVIYAFQRPDVFWGRLGEVTQPDQSVTLAQSIVLHLKLFFIAGDPYFRYNDPGRPYFTPPEGALLLIGLALAAYRLTRRRESPTERTANLLALLSPLMVIPSVISVGGLPPSNMRSLGMVPLIFVLVGIGAEWGIGQIEQMLAQRRQGFKPSATKIAPPTEGAAKIGDSLSGSSGISVAGGLNRLRLTPVLVVLTLLIGGLLVGDLYFRWASDPALFYEADADLSLAAKWLVDQHIDGTPVYLAARDKGHPTVMIEPVPPITWIGTDSLFRPPPGVTGLYIFPRSAPPPLDWAAWLAPGAVANLPDGPDGQPAFQAFRISGDAPLPVDAASFTARSQLLTLVGYDAPSIASGSSGSLSMAWQIDATPSVSDLTPLINVEDAQGSLIYRGDAYTAGTDEWRSGETLIQRMQVSIPPATPPGDYVVRIAWIERSSNTYIPYFDEDGGQGIIWAQIGTLTVTRPTSFPDPAALPMAVRQPTQMTSGVDLLGWDSPPASIRPGELLPLTLYWQAQGTERPPFSLTVRLSGDQGDTSIWTGQPIGDRYTADQWAEGEVLADRVQWRIPREQPAGDYRLVIRSDQVSVTLGTVTVAGIARVFDPPPVEHVINVNFGSQILLYGYDLRQNGSKLSLEIVWKSIDNMLIDYKVFVHLVDGSGAILAQQDAMPQANQYPTSLWLPGEYVVDSYQLSTDTSASALQVGLYTPDDAKRLLIVDADQTEAKDFVEIAYKYEQ